MIMPGSWKINETISYVFILDQLEKIVLFEKYKSSYIVKIDQINL